MNIEKKIFHYLIFFIILTFFSFSSLAETPTISTNSDGLTFTNIGDGTKARFFDGSRSDKLIFTFNSHSFYLTDFSEIESVYQSSNTTFVYGIPSTPTSGYDATINIIPGYGYEATFDLYDNSNSSRLSDNFDPEPESSSFSPFIRIDYKSSSNTIRVSYDDDSGYTAGGVSINSDGTFSNTVTFQSYQDYTLTASNSSPTSNAGPDQTVFSGDTVTLDGTSSSDSDGDSLTYTWSQTSGTSVTISDNNSSQPTFKAPAATGTLVFSLVVNDGTINSSADTVSINVNIPNPLTNNDTTAIIESQNDIIFHNNINTVQSIYSRMNFIRMNKSNYSHQDIQLAFNNKNDEINKLFTYVKDQINLNPSGELSSKIGFWTKGSIEVGGLTETTSASSKTIFSNGVTIGMDFKLSDNFYVGVAVKDDWDEIKIGNNGSAQDIHTTSLSSYQSFNLGNDRFIDFLIGYGDIMIDVDRFYLSDSVTYSGERSGDQIYGSLNFNVMSEKGNYLLNPFGKFDVSYTKLKHYDESAGDYALHYNSMHLKHGSTALGVHIMRDDIVLNNNTVQPFVKLEFGQDISRGSEVVVNYLSDTSTSYSKSINPLLSVYHSQEIGFILSRGKNFTVNTSFKNSIQKSKARFNEIIFELNYNF